MGKMPPLADVVELAELMLRLVGRADVDAILNELEDGEITIHEAIAALRRRLH